MLYTTAITTGSGPQGKPLISVLAKRTYTFTQGKVTEAPEQEPIRDADEYSDPDSPAYAEVLGETEMIAFKPTTDVVVSGSVKTPRGKHAYYLDASVKVGPLGKTVRAYGRRKVELRALRGIAFSQPEPFARLKLGYVLAYGGVARAKDGTLFPYYPNPIGRGFSLKGGVEEPEAIPVPQLEDPQSPITEDSLILGKFDEWTEAPKPASLGWTRRNFYPRYTYAGVMPEFLESVSKNYQEFAKENPGMARGEIPKMDFRVFQGASDGLWGASLEGNEPVRLRYLNEDFPTLEFALPGEVPAMYLDIGEGKKDLPPALHTVAIDVDTSTLTLLWRGASQVDSWEAMGEIVKFEYGVE